MIMYRCLVRGRTEAEGLLAHVRQYATDGTLAGVHTLDSAGGTTLGLRQGDTHAVLYVHALSEGERAGLIALGTPDYCVAFSPGDEDLPEAVGLCWEVMTAINTFHPTPVWIHSAAYSEQTIGRFAEPRRTRFSDGGEGHVLTAEEFAAMLDAPV